jgi:hypothetical protein
MEAHLAVDLVGEDEGRGAGQAEGERGPGARRGPGRPGEAEGGEGAADDGDAA